MQNIMYRYFLSTFLSQKNNLFINYVCYYPDFLSAKYVKQAFPYPSKKNLQVHCKSFFIIGKIPVSKNATNLMKSPSSPFTRASFQIIFVKLFFDASLENFIELAAVWLEPIWIKVNGWWQILRQHQRTFLRGPESASIEIPPFRPYFIKFSKTISYEVNLTWQHSHLEELLLSKFESESGDFNWCRFWAS